MVSDEKTTVNFIEDPLYFIYAFFSLSLVSRFSLGIFNFVNWTMIHHILWSLRIYSIWILLRFFNVLINISQKLESLGPLFPSNTCGFSVFVFLSFVFGFWPFPLLFLESHNFSLVLFNNFSLLICSI